MSEGVVLDPSRLVAGALIGLIILLVLIIKFKVQAMVAILVGAISIGIIAGMPLADIVTSERYSALSRPWIDVRRYPGSFGRRADAGCHNGQKVR